MPTGAGRLTVLVAIVVLVGFAAMLWYLFSISATADERLWTRSIFLYGGVEAVAFAAAGFLFGREVHRERAEGAEARAEAAAREAAQARANGHALVKLIEERVERAPKSPGDLPESARTFSSGDLEELQQVARRLFPD